MTGGPELISGGRKSNFAVIIFRRRRRNSGVGNGLYAREKLPIFAAKMVTFPARNTNKYKSCKVYRVIFSVFYNILQPKFCLLCKFVHSSLFQS